MYLLYRIEGGEWFLIEEYKTKIDGLRGLRFHMKHDRSYAKYHLEAP